MYCQLVGLAFQVVLGCLKYIYQFHYLQRKMWFKFLHSHSQDPFKNDPIPEQKDFATTQQNENKKNGKQQNENNLNNLNIDVSIRSVAAPADQYFVRPRHQPEMIEELIHKKILRAVTLDSLTTDIDIHYFTKFGRRRFIRNIFVSEKEIVDAKKWIFGMYLWIFTTRRRINFGDNGINKNKRNNSSKKAKRGNKNDIISSARRRARGCKTDDYYQYRCQFNISIKEIKQIENTILANANANSKTMSSKMMSYFPTNEYPTPINKNRETRAIHNAKRRENESLKRVPLNKFPSKILGIKCDKKALKHVGDYLNSVFSSVTLLQEPWFWKNFSKNKLKNNNNNNNSNNKNNNNNKNKNKNNNKNRQNNNKNNKNNKNNNNNKHRNNERSSRNNYYNDDYDDDEKTTEDSDIQNTFETQQTQEIYDRPSKISSEECYHNGLYMQYSLFDATLIELIESFANTSYRALTHEATKVGTVSITRLIEFKRDLNMFEFHTCYIVCRPLPQVDFFNHWALKFEGNQSLLTIGFFDSHRKNQSGKVKAELRINGERNSIQRRAFWYYWPLDNNEKYYFTQSWKVIDKIDLLDCSINQIYDNPQRERDRQRRTQQQQRQQRQQRQQQRDRQRQGGKPKAQLTAKAKPKQRARPPSQARGIHCESVFRSPTGKVIGQRGVTAAEIGAIVEAWLTCRLGEYAEYKLGHNNCQHFARDIIACFSTNKAMSLNTLMDHKVEWSLVV